MSKLIPQNGNVIIKPIEEQEQTYGNIVVPDMGKERPEIGEIIAVSDTYNWHTGEYYKSKLTPGQKVLVIEDLISTGKSSLQVVDVLRAAGAEVVGMVAIFTYDFAQASEAFAAANVPFVCLTNYPSLISLAVEKGYVTKEQESILLEWRNSPSTWTGK